MTDFLSQLIKRREADAIGSDEAHHQNFETQNFETMYVPQTDELIQSAATDNPIAHILNSGLFSTEFYLSSYPDIAAAEVDPFEHFFHYGFQEGRCPNPYFEPLWYLDNNADVQEAQSQPLLHYVLYGDREGRRPSVKFDTAWYRRTYGIPPEDGALAHYLSNRTTGRFSPLPDFDVAFYLKENPDVAAAGIDPFEHFINYGYREYRNPSAAFDVKFYTQRYLSGDTGVNPFLHHLAHKHEPGVYGRIPDDEVTVWREVKRFTRPGPDFEDFRPLPPSVAQQFKVLACYLPQFHAITENDAW
jgi:hypothetical protein